VETQLIDELLDTARIARGKLELNRMELDVHATIKDAQFVCLNETDAKHLKVEKKLTASSSLIKGDEVRLKQVFWNLIRNAVKFTSPGGKIILRSHNNTDGEIVVHVEDDGCGLDPGLTEKIFQPFAQADPSVTRRFGGLGLGLSISRSIVEAHGGTLTCHSDGPGKGCRFEARLPLLRRMP
jgi:signal transduction histidine kinase